jgi:hypothetical protein
MINQARGTLSDLFKGICILTRNNNTIIEISGSYLRKDTWVKYKAHHRNSWPLLRLTLASGLSVLPYLVKFLERVKIHHAPSHL